jgi:hypothetical protein
MFVSIIDLFLLLLLIFTLGLSVGAMMGEHPDHKNCNQI